MAEIMTDAITDLTNATLSRYRKNMISDAYTTLQRYVAAERFILGKEKIKTDTGGGNDFKFAILTDGPDNARHIGFYEVNDLDQTSGTVWGTVPHRFWQTGAMYDVKEVPVNSGPEKLFDFLKVRELQMLKKMYDLIESDFWDGASTSADTKLPFGLCKYWFDYYASTTGAFSGVNHTNWSGGPAGISCTTYPNWSHWSVQYSDVSDSDLIRKMREAYYKTEFQGIPNAPVKDGVTGTKHNFGIYTCYSVVSALEELLDGKNDRISNDVAAYDGQVMFRRVPVEPVPYLDANKNTSRPIIMLDWNDFTILTLPGQWMRQDPYYRAGDQNDVRHRFTTSACQFVMQNRRRHALIAKSDPTSS